MKAFMKYRAVRFTVIILSALFAVITFLSAVIVTELINYGFYDHHDSPELLKNDLIYSQAFDYAESVFLEYALFAPDKSYMIKEELDKYASQNGIYYTLTEKTASATQTLLYTQMSEKASKYIFEYTFNPSFHFNADDVSNLTVNYTSTYIVQIGIPKVRTQHDTIYYIDKNFNTFYENRYAPLAICAVTALLTVLTYSAALVGAGRRKHTNETVMTFYDRIPLDLLLAVEGIVSMMFFSLVMDSAYGDDIFFFIAVCICIFIGSIALTLLSMTAVVRIKCRTLWNNNICVRLISWLWRLTVRIFRAIPLFWRALLLICGVAILNLLTFIIWTDGDFALPFVFLWFAIISVTCLAAYNMSRLKRGAERIASGDLDYKISEDNLLFDFKKHAENLNSIGDGMSAAVEERMKGERFKTELITNVSHDIKTPITSIINYVGLLEGKSIEDEEARSYIDVLRRQSERLKKLTEDIVEASKASSGVLNVELSPCDLGILLTQTAGEYEERFTEAGLTLVSRIPEYTVPVLADGKHIFRIFENLLGNALKYSLTGTRVHLSLTEADGYAVATLSNVSREPLPEDGNDLTERFVRGDASRHTEGSGLGLSIAKSLAELQGASLTIKTDGDFFKATFKIKTNNIVLSE